MVRQKNSPKAQMLWSDITCSLYHIEDWSGGVMCLHRFGLSWYHVLYILFQEHLESPFKNKMIYPEVWKQGWEGQAVVTLLCYSGVVQSSYAIICIYGICGCLVLLPKEPKTGTRLDAALSVLYSVCCGNRCALTCSGRPLT